MKKQFVTYAKMFIVAVAIFSGVGYISAQTPPPCSSPSACNVAAPVNIGTTGQIKNGSFGVGGASSSFFVSFFKSYLMGETWVGHDGSIISGNNFPAPGILKVYGGKNPSNSSYPGLDRYGILNGSSAKFGNVNNGNFLEIGFDDAHSTIDGKHSNSGDRGLLLNYYSGGNVGIGGGPGGNSNLTVSGDATISENAYIQNGKLAIGNNGGQVERLQVTGGARIDSGYVVGNLDVGNELTVDVDIRVSSKGGSGNAYACFDASGNLFRSDTPCITAPPPATGTATFSTPGTSNWTVPAGVTSITVKIWGAGGGGAGIDNTPLPSCTSTDGADGGTSEFKNGGTILSAGGGKKGYSGCSSTNNDYDGGLGGVASGGSVNNTGVKGQDGGGSVPFTPNGGATNPLAPSNYGKGGNGGWTSGQGAGAGGGGGYSQTTLAVIPGGTYTIIIGAGGGGGSGIDGGSPGTPGIKGYATISY